MKFCAGDCGLPAPRHRTYCAVCSPVNDPAWRKVRGRKAGAAAGRAHRLRMAETFAGMSRAEAGAHGYRVGYVRAYRYWKVWAERMLKARGLAA